MQNSKRYSDHTLLISWSHGRRRQTSTDRDHESSSCIIQLHPSTSSSPSPPTCHETSPLTKYQCYHWRITYSGAARCTLAGLAARTTRSLLLQTCTGWYGGRVERQWPEGGERELRPAAGGGTGIWKGQE